MAMVATLLWTPLILLYGGTKSSKNDKSYHEMLAIRVPEDCSDKQLKKMVEEVRKLYDTALQAKMLAKFP